MKWIKFIILVLLFSACNSYYYITNVEDIYLYNSPSKTDFSKDIIHIPAGTYYYSTIENKRFRKARVGNSKGYVFNPYFDNPNYLPASIKSQSVSTTSPTSTTSVTTSRPTYNYSSSNSTSNRPKTVNVKGYYRKDGTYVRPHTRSAPRRK